MYFRKKLLSLLPIYLLCPIILIAIALFTSYSVTVYNETSPLQFQKTFIIDAGHGGVDGGATSCTGILESHINLQIAGRLNDFMHLLGMNTLMIRTENVSVYTEGNTIAAKKVSDIKERIRRINQTKNAVLISIHQNHFTDPKYYGAQVFYGSHNHSRNFAQSMQQGFADLLVTNRKIKKAEGVYLMQHVNCPAILIECGFLSNPDEDALLQSEQYQKKLSAIIACMCSQYCQQNSLIA